MSIVTLSSYNYLTDPYGIFTDAFLKLGYEPGYEPNQHYAKMRYVINKKHSWDSYLFGSSRVGKIDPDLIPGGSYYNMSYSEGVPGEHLSDIRILLKNGIPVKNVMIGLDNTSYTFRPADHTGQILRHPYDETLLKRIYFLIKYLCFAPRISIERYVRFIRNEHVIVFDIEGNGMQRLEKVDKNIESNIEMHVRSDRFLKANIIPFDVASEAKYRASIDDTLKDIEDIIDLSKRYQFNLYFFVNPTHKIYYLYSNPNHFVLFKEKLAQITNYWDFSGINTITTNNYYYYETSHYRIMVGNLMVCKMTNCDNINVPEDFGVYITQGNINDHITKQRDDLIENSNM